MKQRILFFLLLICLTMAVSRSVFADTDGNELQVFIPSKLEIQLGSDWANSKFELKTDVGVYPEPIFTDSTGILRLEIGGSSTYVLSCLSMGSIHTTSPESAEASAQSEKSGSSQPESHAPAQILVLVFAGALLFIAGALFNYVWFCARNKTT